MFLLPTGKIYTVRSLKSDEVYVGSTIQELSMRMGGHRKNWKNGEVLGKNKLIVENIEDWYIELHELFPCNLKTELKRREGEVIREIGTLNKCIAGRTTKEYYTDHQEEIKQYRTDHKEEIKQYRTDHKEEIKQYYTDHKEENKERNKQYQTDHKEEIKQYQKQYQADNKGKKKQYNKQYQTNHKEEIKQYQTDHKEEIKERKKQYKTDHKEEIKQYNKQYNLKNKLAKSQPITE